MTRRHSSSTTQPAQHGLHWEEWAAEAVGTAVLLFGGLSAICLDIGHGSPVRAVLPGASPRLLLTGLLFADPGYRSVFRTEMRSKPMQLGGA